MGWYTQAIFDNNAMMGLPFFLSEDITDMFQDRAMEEISPNILEHLKLRYSGNFLRRREDQFSFEIQNNELSIRLNGHNMSRLTSAPLLDLNRAGMGLEDINKSLKQLLDNVRNPSQTWALEQFDIARKAFTRQQYEDALAYVNNAIGGSGAQTGYKLDHRFYYLKGLILFGDMQGITGDLVDYQRAREAFEAAAKYATNSADRSECLCKAGLSACAAGQHKDAFDIFHQACETNPSDALAYYLFACLNFPRGSDKKAQNYLEQAFMLDLDMVTIALNDPSARFFEKNLETVISKVRKTHVDAVRPFVVSGRVKWDKSVARIEAEDSYETLFPNTENHVRAVAAELKNIDLGKLSVFEAGILDKYFERDYEHLIDELLGELGNDKSELLEDLEDFKSDKNKLREKKPPGIRSFGKIYRDVWKRSWGLTLFGLLFVLIGLFTLFFILAYNGESHSPDAGTLWRVSTSLAGTLVIMLFLSIVVIPLWFIIRAVWTFVKSFVVGLFSVSRDKAAKEKFKAQKRQQIDDVETEIVKVEADLSDAKALRKDLMELLRLS